MKKLIVSSVWAIYWLPMWAYNTSKLKFLDQWLLTPISNFKVLFLHYLVPNMYLFIRDHSAFLLYFSLPFWIKNKKLPLLLSLPRIWLGKEKLINISRLSKIHSVCHVTIMHETLKDKGNFKFLLLFNTILQKSIIWKLLRHLIFFVSFSFNSTLIYQNFRFFLRTHFFFNWNCRDEFQQKCYFPQ